jgi:hypothetical protein
MNQSTRALEKLALLAACMVAALLGGCSTQVRVSELDNALTAGSEVNGVPFRAMRRYKLALYRLTPEGKYVHVQADKGTATLPDPERLYVLQMKGQPLSDDTVTVTLNPDSTIKKLVVDVKGKDKEGLDAITKAIGDVDAARTAKDTAAETSTTTGEAARLAAQKARFDAEVAELELAALPADASAVTRRLAESKVANLKLEANQKARKAGVSPLPFPDVGT